MHESHSAVTRQISQLEAHFGVRLFHRTTRSLSLTNDGRELLNHARQMLELGETMEVTLGRQRTSPRGLVRLGTTVAFGLFLVPRSQLLLERHPRLSLELVIRDGITDLIEESPRSGATSGDDCGLLADCAAIFHGAASSGGVVSVSGTARGSGESRTLAET